MSAVLPNEAHPAADLSDAAVLLDRPPTNVEARDVARRYGSGDTGVCRSASRWRRSPPAGCMPTA
jgi:hypothetical protein